MNTFFEKIWAFALMCLKVFRNITLWFVPLVLLIICLALLTSIFDLGFEDFKQLIVILIWPFTVLTVLFFFKKIFTYLFFSMNEFNFFGAKGNLENVNAVITREVEKRFENQRRELEIAEDRKKSEKIMGQLKIKLKDSNKSKEENLDLAKQIFNEWRKAGDTNKKESDALRDENLKLKQEISSLTPAKTILAEAGIDSQQFGQRETSEEPATEDSDASSSQITK